MKRLFILAVVVLIYGPLHAQQATVDTMTALRALAAPTVDGYEVKLRGYHRLGDNTPQTYRWSTGSSAAADGGAVVTPSTSPATGRWLLVWDGVTANVRTWGATVVADIAKAVASDDSLAAINNAIKALPVYVSNDHSEPPGAAGSGHTRAGQLYFPAGYYMVSGEILLSAYMRVLGDGAPYSMISFLPNAAPSAASPKWIIRYLYNNGPGNTVPNENFATGIWGIGVNGLTSGNLGSCGIYFVGSNSTYMSDCAAEAALQPFKVDSKGVVLDRLVTGNGCRGPGLEITGNGGAEVSGGYMDIEHVNAGSKAIIDPTSNLPYPAVWLHDLQGFSLGVIATESSPLSVRMTNCFGGIIQNIHANPNPQPPLPSGAAVVWIDGQGDDIGIASMSESPTTTPVGIVDNSTGTDTGGMGRNIVYSPGFGRGSYYQKIHPYSAEMTNLSTTNLAVTNLNATNITGSGAGLTNIKASQITGVTAATFQSQPTVARSTDYTLADTDRATRQVYNSATPLNLTLGAPSSTAFVNGWYFVASNTGIVPMTLAAPKGCTIDGQTSISLPPRTQAVITSDGTNYVSSLANSGGERLIDFYELAGDAASVSFTIPPGFHHLHLMSDGRTTSAQTLLIAQINGDNAAGHYVRNYMYTAGGTVYCGQETTNPGLCVGAMNDPSAPFPAQNDTVISLGSITPNPTNVVSAVTNCTAYSGQAMLVNNSALWTAPLKSNPTTATKAASVSPSPSKRTGAAVTSMTILPVAGNIVAGSTFYLYGY